MRPSHRPESRRYAGATDVGFSGVSTYVCFADMMNGRIWHRSLDVDNEGTSTVAVNTGRRGQRFVFTG